MSDISNSDFESEMFWFDHAAEPGTGFQIPGGAVLSNVHPRIACLGEFCCLHNPSDHPLKDAPMNWRADRGIMERLCEHGIGHDDPDDLAYRKRAGREASGSHGCDGCCTGTKF